MTTTSCNVVVIPLDEYKKLAHGNPTRLLKKTYNTMFTLTRGQSIMTNTIEMPREINKPAFAELQLGFMMTALTLLGLR